MYDDRTPILTDMPREHDTAIIYPLHDLHYGSKQFDLSRYLAVKKMILADDNAYVVFVGDLMENAIPNSKGDTFDQTHTPHEQLHWVADELKEYGKKVLAVVPGNHEKNRTTRTCGLYPLYDACVMAGVQHVYRDGFAVLDVGIGMRDKDKTKQSHYVGYIVHRAKEMVNFSTADTLEGFDFMLYGHDHRPKDIPRAHLVYDTKLKRVSSKNIDVINCGSMMEYGGYAIDGAYRPNSQKQWKLVLNGKRKEIQTIGYYV